MKKGFVCYVYNLPVYFLHILGYSEFKAIQRVNLLNILSYEGPHAQKS